MYLEAFLINIFSGRIFQMIEVRSYWKFLICAINIAFTKGDLVEEQLLIYFQVIFFLYSDLIKT